VAIKGIMVVLALALAGCDSLPKEEAKRPQYNFNVGGADTFCRQVETVKLGPDGKPVINPKTGKPEKEFKLSWDERDQRPTVQGIEELGARYVTVCEGDGKGGVKVSAIK
jgi:hypothetical protein